MPIFVFCPECKDMVSWHILRNEIIPTKHFGTVEITEFDCPKGHIWGDVITDSDDDTKRKIAYRREQYQKGERSESSIKEEQKP